MAETVCSLPLYLSSTLSFAVTSNARSRRTRTNTLLRLAVWIHVSQPPSFFLYLDESSSTLSAQILAYGSVTMFGCSVRLRPQAPTSREVPLDLLESPAAVLIRYDKVSVAGTVRKAKNQVASNSHKTPAVRARTNLLRVGSGNKIMRWKRGSVLTYNTDPGSFGNVDAELRERAKVALIGAAEKYNGLALGVTFKCVDDSESAVFQLVYTSGAPSSYWETYAEAFFPGDPPELRKLHVHAASFAPDNIDYLDNIFQHEIGHILGLRHEGAHAYETDDKSVLFGPENPDSVMNSSKPRQLCLRDLDREWLRKFYAYDVPTYGGLPIVDVTIAMV